VGRRLVSSRCIRRSSFLPTVFLLASGVSDLQCPCRPCFCSLSFLVFSPDRFLPFERAKGRSTSTGSFDPPSSFWFPVNFSTFDPDLALIYSCARLIPSSPWCETLYSYRAMTSLRRDGKGQITNGDLSPFSSPPSVPPPS